MLKTVEVPRIRRNRPAYWGARAESRPAVLLGRTVHDESVFAGEDKLEAA